MTRRRRRRTGRPGRNPGPLQQRQRAAVCRVVGVDRQPLCSAECDRRPTIGRRTSAVGCIVAADSAALAVPATTPTQLVTSGVLRYPLATENYSTLCTSASPPPVAATITALQRPIPGPDRIAFLRATNSFSVRLLAGRPDQQ